MQQTSPRRSGARGSRQGLGRHHAHRRGAPQRRHLRSSDREDRRFAKQHRIFGTPTMILSDGRRLVGAVPRAELEKRLHRAAKP
ncbi:thioredoxin fold domain-containing protein [Cupriavidus basilensis]